MKQRKIKTGMGASYANARGMNATYLDRNGNVVRPKGSRGYVKPAKPAKPAKKRRSLRSTLSTTYAAWLATQDA